MWETWLSTNASTVGGVVVSAILVYGLIIAYVRAAGLRSFSKMTAPDFAMTVAVGSLFGSAVSSPSPTVGTAAVSLAMLFAGQKLVARLRASAFPTQWMENGPVLLARDGELRHEAMARCGVTEADIRGKLRECNAKSLSAVEAIVFESTGDVSVLHGETSLDAWVMQDVNGWSSP